MQWNVLFPGFNEMPLPSPPPRLRPHLCSLTRTSAIAAAPCPPPRRPEPLAVFRAWPRDSACTSSASPPVRCFWDLKTGWGLWKATRSITYPRIYTATQLKVQKRAVTGTKANHRVQGLQFQTHPRRFKAGNTGVRHENQGERRYCHEMRKSPRIWAQTTIQWQRTGTWDS